MTSFRQQLDLAEAARIAVAALETSSRQNIEEIFQQWEAGDLTNQTVRYRLEAVVRTAYRSSASISRQTAMQNSGLEPWTPAETFNSEYLQDLLSDVRRNLRDYKVSAQDEKARRRAVFRISHSAGVAAQRGYTDQTIAAYTELEDFGYNLRKVWVANFVDNTPCPSCVRLHGTSVGLHEFFMDESGPGVYRDLMGPPRHPNCQCKIVVLIRTLENAFDTLDIATPPPTEQMMSTDAVKLMPKSIFKSVVAVLKSIARLWRR